MSGAGKWVKKNPLQAVGLLAATVMTAGAAAPLLAGGAAAAEGAAAAGGLLAGDAALAGGSALAAEAGGGAVGALSPMAAEVASVPLTAATPASGGLMAALDKMSPYAKLAGQAQNLMSPEQQQQMPPPMAQRPQMVAQSGGMGGLLPYGDPAEEEKWRRMQQSGRFYG